MFKKLSVLKSGRVIHVERPGRRSRVYHPGNFSLRRVIRLLLRYQGARNFKKFFVLSTTGGWEHFDTSITVNTTCVCSWHRERYPERFEESYNAFSYPEPPREYSPE